MWLVRGQLSAITVGVRARRHTSVCLPDGSGFYVEDCSLLNTEVSSPASFSSQLCGSAAAPAGWVAGEKQSPRRGSGSPWLSRCEQSRVPLPRALAGSVADVERAVRCPASL